jgi:large subunit ribosomal protein L13
MKFSAFNKPDGVDRDYTVKDEWKRRESPPGERFVPKPEFTRRPWDENVRHRIDDIHNELIFRGISYDTVKPEA